MISICMYKLDGYAGRLPKLFKLSLPGRFSKFFLIIDKRKQPIALHELEIKYYYQTFSVYL